MKRERGKPDRRDCIRHVERMLAVLSLLASIAFPSYEAKAIPVVYRGYRTTETALIMAVRAHNIGRARALLVAGANIDDRDEYAGRTALMWAAQVGSVDIARVLLDRGANPGLADEEGSTALTIAHVRGYAALAQLIRQRIQRREHLDAKHRKQRTASIRLATRSK